MSGVNLFFDGLTLSAVDSTTGATLQSWEAISGRPGQQDPALSGEQDVGPIPQGSWFIQTDNIIDMDELPVWRQLLSSAGAVSPVGGRYSWGETFVRIEPDTGTDTLGRFGFHIHGGNAAGSAGCIDLVGGNDSFFQFMSNYSEQISLTVDYSGNEALLSTGTHPLLVTNEPRHDAGSSEEAFRTLESLYDGDLETTQWFISQFGRHCFGAGTQIDMWPIDPTLKPGPDGVYDQEKVRKGVWTKPIEDITASDVGIAP